MKKTICLILSLIMLLSSVFIVSAQKYDLPQKMQISFCVGDSTLLINGEEKTVETPYIAGYGTTLVPVRVISESFGAKVDWEHETKKIFINYPKNEIVLQIGNKTAEVNGEKQILEEPPALSKSGTSMVPLRFISEALGALVTYDEDTKRILVTKETEMPEILEMQTDCEDYIEYGDGLQNTFVKLTKDKSLKIGYIGGSVTVGDRQALTDNSWRGRTNKWFVQNFPDAEISEINAAIGSTGTKLGAYRVKRDIIDHNPDLVFIEFAINDRYCCESEASAKMYFESMVRQIKTELPLCDIVTVLLIDRGTASSGSFPASNAHLAVSKYYGIPVVFSGKYFVSSIPDLSDDTWSRYYSDSAHPRPYGYELIAEPIAELLHNCLLATEYEELSYKEYTLKKANFSGELSGLKLETANEMNFEIESGWNHSELRPFIDLTNSPYMGILSAVSDDNKLTFTFSGREIGLITNYPGGTVHVSIDGKPEKTYSSQNAPIMIGSGLTKRKHTVTIRAGRGFSFGGIVYR